MLLGSVEIIRSGLYLEKSNSLKCRVSWCYRIECCKCSNSTIAQLSRDCSRWPWYSVTGLFMIFPFPWTDKIASSYLRSLKWACPALRSLKYSNRFELDLDLSKLWKLWHFQLFYRLFYRFKIFPEFPRKKTSFSDRSYRHSSAMLNNYQHFDFLQLSDLVRFVKINFGDLTNVNTFTIAAYLGNWVFY